MGTGKSSLSSKLIGIKLMHEDAEDEVEFREKRYGDLIRVDQNDIEDHFGVGGTKISVTKESSFVVSHLLGNEERRRVMLIDSPGFFDPEENASDELREKILEDPNRKRMVTDLVEKLEALGSVDCVILLMKLEGGRVPANLITAMKALEEMFQKSSGTFVSNLALVMSKCDEAKLRDYRKKMKNKDSEYQEIIKTFQKFGVEVSNENSSQLFFLTSVDETLESIGRLDEFERIFKFMDECSPLSTEEIKDPTELMQGKVYFQKK